MLLAQQAQRSPLLRTHWQQVPLLLVLAVLLGRVLPLRLGRQTAHPGDRQACWVQVLLQQLLRALAVGLQGSLHVVYMAKMLDLFADQDQASNTTRWVDEQGA